MLAVISVLHKRFILILCQAGSGCGFFLCRKFRRSFYIIFEGLEKCLLSK